MGQHFYYNEGDKVRLSESVDSAAKARKSKTKVYPSVTTKLSYLPNGFIGQWKDKKIVELAREFPEKELEELQELRWGTRTMPDGSTVSSSHFGTLVHEQIELATNAYIEGADYHNFDWLEYYRPIIRWFEDCHVHPKHTEYLVADDDYNTAGSIDGVGKDLKTGQIILWDMKTRSAGKNIKDKAYAKDAAQLAVEADIIRKQWELDYIPRIYTVLIDTDTGEAYFKLWTEKAQAKALAQFDAVSKFYDAIEGL